MSESSEKAREQIPTSRTLNEVLWTVGLSIKDLRNKKILDVGTGGGKAFAQARKHGLDYYAVDILPAYSVKEDVNYIFWEDVIRREEMRRELLSNAISNPSRIIAADAAVALPFLGDSFDMVLASKSVPMYTKNADEAIRSIIEMIRICQGIVAVSDSFDNNGNFAGRYNRFTLNLKGFWDALKESGISYQTFEDPKGSWLPWLHIDTTKKNNDLFYEKARELLNDPNYPETVIDNKSAT